MALKRSQNRQKLKQRYTTITCPRSLLAGGNLQVISEAPIKKII